MGKESGFFTGSYDGRVLFWDSETKLATPVTGPGHTNQIVKLVNADQGNDVISVGMDDTMRVFDGAEKKFKY